MRHGRLPWYTPDGLSEQQRAIYDGVLAKYGPEPPFALHDDAGRLHGPFNAMLAAPEVGAAWQRLSAAVGATATLSPRVRELVILTVATIRKSAFEWSAHRRAGLAAGLTEAEIAALGRNRTPESLSAPERAALDFARSLLRDRDADDPEYAAVRTGFGDAGAVELIVLVGYYDMLATLLRTLRVPVPED
ncbi:carboxymuconolactone decarboxylase family protein [Nocardiopsis ansamitocini]|uniref:Carboxymuconolactone decarboxylase n=1 Tax=Nocardiopsis ansamitocini TaxID=1670832 RepID=A0A9W6P5M2_9ACTN|nr:carboxymuconolactone decarboxylase family protein [Nocardiopsis ansamitocini]GLU47499.1 carboxymuconolactone decarboxylase [Nocardiopsis ansamitocini]